MISTISEIDLEAIRQDATSEHINIKPKFSKFIFPLKSVRYVHYFDISHIGPLHFKYK
jgi:hypothetical protein